MELKKNPRLDLERRRPLFFQIGLVVALFFVIVAFEWRSEVTPIEVSEPKDDPDMVYFPPATVIPPPPIPVKQIVKLESKSENTTIIEVTDLLPMVSTFNLDTEPIDELPGDIVYDIPIEIPDEPFYVSEVMPSFKGGEKAFLDYISKNLKYPRDAQHDNISGKVTLSFIIDKNGSVSDIKVIKGIGFGCDEEAIRVLKNSPKWSPGKQRGIPVKVRQTIAINFRLN